MAEQYQGVDNRHLPRTPASEISYSEFKTPTRVRMTNETVGTGVAELVRANSNRISILIINNSASIVYIGYQPDITSTFNIRLTPNGGTFAARVKDDGEMVTSQIYAFSSLAARPVTVVESLA